MQEKLALYAQPVDGGSTVAPDYQNPYQPPAAAGSVSDVVTTIFVIGIALVSVYLVYRLVKKDYWVSAAVFLFTATTLGMVAANLIGVRTHSAFMFFNYNLGPILLLVSLLAFAFGIYRLERTVRAIERSFLAEDTDISKE